MIRKLRKSDLNQVAGLWLDTNKKAYDFINKAIDWSLRDYSKTDPN